MNRLRNLLVAAAVSVAATGLIGLFWKVIGGDLPPHGWIALSLGVLGTVVLASVLMGLAFKSSREGWDDQFDNTLDLQRGSNINGSDGSVLGRLEGALNTASGQKLTVRRANGTAGPEPPAVDPLFQRWQQETPPSCRVRGANRPRSV